MRDPTFDYYTIFWCTLFLFSSPILCWNAVSFIQKLLKKLFPILSIDKSVIKAALIENREINKKIVKESSSTNVYACIKGSFLSNGNYLTIPYTEKPKHLYIPFLIFLLSLPLLCYLIIGLFGICSTPHHFDFDEPKVAVVITTVNPCNETDSSKFQNFVKLWKENNEVQMKLNEWTNVIAEKDTPPTIKEYFLQKIQTVEKEIKTLNATLEPEFRIYNDCFFTNNESKRNSIKNYCFITWIFSVICATICCSIAISCSTFLHNIIYPENEGFGFIEYRTYTMVTLMLYAPYSFSMIILLQEYLINDIQKEFLL